MPKNIINMHAGMAVNQSTAAKLAGVSIPTIKSWERQGLLHSTLINGNKLFDLDELVPLIRERNPHSRNSYLIADIPDYDNFIQQITQDVAEELLATFYAKKKAGAFTD
jgi:phage terminase Nu1 subunit (DNA packaging protein)